MTKIKICGLKNFEDALFAHNSGADALGFVIDVPVDTPRKINSQTARDIITQLPPYAVTVGVTIPFDIKEVLKIIEQTRIDVIQIHGNSGFTKIQEIKKRNNVKVVRCYSMDVNTNINNAIKTIGEYIETGIDGILLDTRGEKSAGGTGRKHDWAKSKEIKESFNFPFILAGGLTPENVLDAISLVDPYAVDVANGVESIPGVKDKGKIKEFIEKVRNF